MNNILVHIYTPIFVISIIGLIISVILYFIYNSNLYKEEISIQDLETSKTIVGNTKISLIVFSSILGIYILYWINPYKR